ncbi:MAG: AAA family ATPase, partial [Bacteroidales bacterium]
MGGKKAYLFKSLSIHKIPGFPRGMKEIEDFSENINLVVGPNASGKSSTARALQQLIWYNEGGSKDRLEAKVVLGEENWSIERDFGKRLVQKNRKDAEMAGIPASEGKSRYLLALDSMMYEEESDLAKEIVKQSIGGYDLDAARD